MIINDRWIYWGILAFLVCLLIFQIFRFRKISREEKLRPIYNFQLTHKSELMLHAVILKLSELGRSGLEFLSKGSWRKDSPQRIDSMVQDFCQDEIDWLYGENYKLYFLFKDIQTYYMFVDKANLDNSLVLLQGVVDKYLEVYTEVGSEDPFNKVLGVGRFNRANQVFLNDLKVEYNNILNRLNSGEKVGVNEFNEFVELILNRLMSLVKRPGWFQIVSFVATLIAITLSSINLISFFSK